MLERVTAFGAARFDQDYGEMKRLKIAFSERGGHKYSQTRVYHAYLTFRREAELECDEDESQWQERLRKVGR